MLGLFPLQAFQLGFLPMDMVENCGGEEGLLHQLDLHITQALVWVCTVPWPKNGKGRQSGEGCGRKVAYSCPEP